jgi:hypothetical protein
MYNISRLAPTFMEEVEMFVDNPKKHTLSENWKEIVCPRFHWKDELSLDRKQ